MLNRFYFILAAALIFPVISHGASVHYGQKKAEINGEFAEGMQCIIDGLEKQRYIPKEVGCMGTRPNNRSAHPTGHACDVDQTARDVAEVNRVGKDTQISLAQGCKAVSGCIWPNSDCGHFEMQSAPYSAAGAGIARHHYYSERYATRPVSRQRAPVEP